MHHLIRDANALLNQKYIEFSMIAEADLGLLQHSRWSAL